VVEEEVLAFINESIRSVWSLEILVAMMSNPRRSWQTEELVREVRGSTAVVLTSMSALVDAGLVAAGAAGEFSYQPKSAERGALAEKLVRAYSERPVAVVKAILTAPSDKVRTFADAFIVKKKRD
jgi:hypothetical protein